MAADLEVLERAVESVFARPDPLTAPLRVLESVAERIGRALGAPVDVEHSYLSDLGQRYAVRAHLGPGQSQTLFTAYLPREVYPVRLDLYGGRDLALARDDEELVRRVAEFVQEPDMAAYLRSLRRQANPS